jgi:DNA-binding FadR family transcriptional regulator
VTTNEKAVWRPVSSASPYEIRLPKTSEVVASRIRRRIITGELSEGDALPSEAAMISQFRVSRPALREALRLLEAEGLIGIRRGNQGGARVCTPNPDAAARYAGLVLQYQGTTLADVYATLINLEAPCARFVAEHRSEEQLQGLAAALDEADRQRNSPEESLESQQMLHYQLVDMVGSDTTLLVWKVLQHIIGVAQMRRLKKDPSEWVHAATTDKGYKAHRRLFAYIEARNGAKAEALWRRHLEGDAEYALEGAGSETVLDLLG